MNALESVVKEYRENNLRSQKRRNLWNKNRHGDTVGTDLLQGVDITKFIKSLRLRWHGHTKGMNNSTMPEWKERGPTGYLSRYSELL